MDEEEDLILPGEPYEPLRLKPLKEIRETIRQVQKDDRKNKAEKSLNEFWKKQNKNKP